MGTVSCICTNKRTYSHQASIVFYSIPHSFQLVDHFVVNENKSLSSPNGIDIHPSRNLCLASGCKGGDVLLYNLDCNKEIKRIKIPTSNGDKLNNYLWSPSGKHFLITTSSPSCLYIYSKNGHFFKSINTLSDQDALGAIWLTDDKIAVGFETGIVKIFCVAQEGEIENLKCFGSFIWGMDIVDESHLLVGDSGTLFLINWKSNILVWKKEDWQGSGNSFTVIKVSRNKKKALTGSDDSFIKCIILQDQSLAWDFKMNSSVLALIWAPTDAYVLALAKNQLIILNESDGHFLLQCHEDLIGCECMKLNERTKELLVGDENGCVKRLKLRDYHNTSVYDSKNFNEKQQNPMRPINRRASIQLKKQLNQSYIKLVYINVQIEFFSFVTSFSSQYARLFLIKTNSYTNIQFCTVQARDFLSQSIAMAGLNANIIN